MKKYIYPICGLAAVLTQMFLRSLLRNGTLSAIPGDLIIYPIAWFIAKKWTQAYEEKQG